LLILSVIGLQEKGLRSILDLTLKCDVDSGGEQTRGGDNFIFYKNLF